MFYLLVQKNLKERIFQRNFLHLFQSFLQGDMKIEQLLNLGILTEFI